MVRTGQPLYLKDLNCHCIDPTHDQVLNPAAWANPAAGTYGPGPIFTGVIRPAGTFDLLYTDFRAQRRPSESFNIMRSFRLNKGDRPVVLSIRADFTNILNRTLMPNPSTSCTVVNAAGVCSQVPTKNGAGQYTAGFGVVNGGTGGGGEVFAIGAYPAASNVTASQLPRQGTVVARITF